VVVEPEQLGEGARIGGEGGLGLGAGAQEPLEAQARHQQRRQPHAVGIRRREGPAQ
jgi:hypothetical protein